MEQEGKESCRKIRITRHHYPRGQNDGSWKFQALKCGPDKSRHQGPHPFSIQTRRKVAYPLGASILSSASFSSPSCSCSSPFQSFFRLSLLRNVRTEPRVSASAAAEVPPLAITMKDGHRIWPRSFLTNTHLRLRRRDPKLRSTSNKYLRGDAHPFRLTFVSFRASEIIHRRSRFPFHFEKLPLSTIFLSRFER